MIFVERHPDDKELLDWGIYFWHFVVGSRVNGTWYLANRLGDGEIYYKNYYLFMAKDFWRNQ